MEILNVKPFSSGSLKAFFDVFIPKTGMEVYGCSLFLKNNRWWASLPSKDYVADDGTKKYSSVCRYRDKDTAGAWSDAVVKLVHQYCANNGIHLQQDQSPVAHSDGDGMPF